MESCDVIEVTVDLETSELDAILFWKQTSNVGSSRASPRTESSVRFALIQDGLICDDEAKSFKDSIFDGKAICTGVSNKEDISEAEHDSMEESASHRNNKQIGKGLSSDQHDEQMMERTRQDTTRCFSTKIECMQLRKEIDPIIASCFMCEMRNSQVYRQMTLKNLYSGCCTIRRASKGQQSGSGIRLVLDLKQQNLFKMEPDIRWSKKMLPLWLGRIAMEDSFSWLSTLGGAYSALGDDFIHFAEKAGKVSIHQMKLACQIGDPILLARCRVYMAQSLMQKGFIQQAMFIVRAQYRFALSLSKNRDQRLINMCKGVWSIIQYLHRRKKERRKNGVGLHPARCQAR